jgi:hypothetical protein
MENRPAPHAHTPTFNMIPFRDDQNNHPEIVNRLVWNMPTLLRWAKAGKTAEFAA